MDGQVASGPRSATVVTVAVTTVAWGASVATGIAAQLGVVDTSGVRWLHHALYGAVVAATVTTLATSSARLRLVPAVVFLTALTRTRGRTGAHALTASLGAVCWVAGRPRGGGRGAR